LQQIGDALQSFTTTPGGDGIALIYFAGHGVEHYGAGFILPSDFPFPVKQSGLRHFGVSTAELCTALMSKKGAKVLMLDSCRTWPALDEREKTAFSEQLDEIRASETRLDNLIISYSTSASEAALDGKPGASSRYCDAFCEHSQRHDLSIEDCFKVVGSVVLRNSNGKQRPWYYSSLNATVSFSDLSPYTVVHSDLVPISRAEGHSPIVVGAKPGSIFIAGGRGKLFEACLGKLKRVRVPSEITNIAALASFHGGLAVVCEQGILSIFGQATYASVPTGIRPFGILSCDDKLLVYGLDGWKLLSYKNGSIVAILSANTDWSIHAGVLVSPNSAWLAGAHGKLISIAWGPAGVSWEPLPSLSNFVNSLAIVDKNTVFCGGDDGLLVGLSQQTGKTKIRIDLPKLVELAASRWRSLANFMDDDDRLLRFILRPDTIPTGILELLETHVEPNRILYVIKAPGLPVVLVGTNEGIVELIDTRDGRRIQRIDVEGGRGSELRGAQFLSQTMFVTLSEDGSLRFYGSSRLNSWKYGPFLTVEDDKKLLQSR
jgi:hypothetical protein